MEQDKSRDNTHTVPAFRSENSSFFLPPPPRHVRRRNLAGVDGGLIRGSSVHRPKAGTPIGASGIISANDGGWETEVQKYIIKNHKFYFMLVQILKDEELNMNHNRQIQYFGYLDILIQCSFLKSTREGPLYIFKTFIVLWFWGRIVDLDRICGVYCY